MKKGCIDNLLDMIDGKITENSRLLELRQTRNGSECPTYDRFLKDLKDIYYAIEITSGLSVTAEHNTQANIEQSRFAFINEVSAEFGVRLYRTRLEAEDAYNSFYTRNEELFEDGEVSADIVEVTPQDWKRSGVLANQYGHFFVCRLEGRIDISFFSDRARRDNAMHDFTTGDEYNANEQVIGGGVVFVG
ncbi:hypothetical protein [Qipengyuania sp. MTN3-11]|uniref:hypothetical protein n=1 Tax=Qipengyuania sp. MTN3-11 TaxID=3056557 RepID=UPI0036F386C9